MDEAVREGEGRRQTLRLFGLSDWVNGWGKNKSGVGRVGSFVSEIVLKYPHSAVEQAGGATTWEFVEMSGPEMNTWGC